MASTERPELRRLMAQVPIERAVAVVVFGSVARGDSDEGSDFDVLVVVDDDDARRQLRDRLRADRSVTTSPLIFTPDGLRNELDDRPSFVSHLLEEGVAVHEGPAWEGLRAELRGLAVDPAALAREVKSRARHLRPLAQADRFSSSPVTVLSHLYGISRSLVIARLLQEGIHEYRWRRVFDRYAEVRPDLRANLDALKALRPYYEYARARTGAELPDRVVSVDEVRDLVHAASQLAQ